MLRQDTTPPNNTLFIDQIKQNTHEDISNDDKNKTNSNSKNPTSNSSKKEIDSDEDPNDSISDAPHITNENIDHNTVSNNSPTVNSTPIITPLQLPNQSITTPIQSPITTPLPQLQLANESITPPPALSRNHSLFMNSPISIAKPIAAPLTHDSSPENSLQKEIKIEKVNDTVTNNNIESHWDKMIRLKRQFPNDNGQILHCNGPTFHFHTSNNNKQIGSIRGNIFEYPGHCIDANYLGLSDEDTQALHHLYHWKEFSGVNPSGFEFLNAPSHTIVCSRDPRVDLRTFNKWLKYIRINNAKWIVNMWYYTSCCFVDIKELKIELFKKIAFKDIFTFNCMSAAGYKHVPQMQIHHSNLLELFNNIFPTYQEYTICFGGCEDTNHKNQRYVH